MDLIENILNDDSAIIVLIMACLYMCLFILNIKRQDDKDDKDKWKDNI